MPTTRIGKKWAPELKIEISLNDIPLTTGQNIISCARIQVSDPGPSCLQYTSLNSLPASDNCCLLLIILTNSLNPDQAQQIVGPDLDPNCLTLWLFHLKNFLKKLILSMQNYPACKELNWLFSFKCWLQVWGSQWRTEMSPCQVCYHGDVWYTKFWENWSNSRISCLLRVLLGLSFKGQGWRLVHKLK